MHQSFVLLSFGLPPETKQHHRLLPAYPPEKWAKFRAASWLPRVNSCNMDPGVLLRVNLREVRGQTKEISMEKSMAI